MSYRLIDSNAIADKYPEVNDMPCVFADLPNGLDGSFIDVHPVVRCKDCKHNYSKKHNKHYNHEDIVCDYFETDGLNDDDFCSYGERRTDE